MAGILDWLWGPKDPKHKGVHAGRAGAHKGNRAAIRRQANRNAPRFVASAPAPFGSYRRDRVARGGGPLVGARANVSGRTVHNAYDARTGRRHNPVQAAANQYSHWWGRR